MSIKLLSIYLLLLQIIKNIYYYFVNELLLFVNWVNWDTECFIKYWFGQRNCTN